jgi:hypothetical protein
LAWSSSDLDQEKLHEDDATRILKNRMTNAGRMKFDAGTKAIMGVPTKTHKQVYGK